MQYFSKQDTVKLEHYLGVKKNPGEYEKKLWEKVERYQKIFSKIPGVLCICVCNSLAMNATHKLSDIDLFIITKKNRLWSVRIYFTVLLIIIRQRKTAKKHAGKFCLSFFITEDAIDLSKIAIKNDIYLYYWIKTLRPIINHNQSFEKFFEKNKISPLGKQSSAKLYHRKRDEMQPLSPLGREDSGMRVFIGDFIESLFKTLFLPRTKKSFQKLGKPFGVIISDDMLKFHDKDRRKEIRDTILDSKITSTSR